MFTQPYSNVFPVVRLFRRLLAEGVSIGDMQAKIDSMKASGEIKFPNPREQLPERWWLVELPYDTPHGRKLSIETDDVNRPLDPLLINCCERLPPPGTAVTARPIEPILPIDRAKAVLRALYPTKEQMPRSLKEATRAVDEKCTAWSWEPVTSPDTVHRAAEDIKYRAPRKPRRRVKRK